MKKITLQSIVLKNFKGVREFALVTQGQSLKVYGDNEAGKTTLFDAFIWLLFDKDSQNKKDFQLKTVDENGKEFHGLEHSVEARFLVDGDELTLKKVFSEKWSKKRGSATSEFSGHTTDYYINDIPSKKGEYTDRIKSLVEEDIFKLLTSPSYFNEQLHWEKRRKLLLEVCGDVTDEEVVRGNQNLVELLQIIEKRSIDEHKRLIAAKRTEINKELDRLPVRIDEVRHSMPTLSGLDESVIKNELKGLQDKATELKDEEHRILNGSEVTKKQQELSDIRYKETQARRAYHDSFLKNGRKEREEIREKEYELNGLNRNIQQFVRDLQTKNDRHTITVSDMNNLKDEFYKVQGETFDDHSLVCQTCSQELPEDQKAAAKERFNQKKADKLAKINAEGKRLKGFKENLAAEIQNVQESLKSNQELAKKLEGELQELKEKTQLEIQYPAFETTDEYKNLRQQEVQLENEIHELRRDATAAAAAVKEQLYKVNSAAEALRNSLARFGQVEQAKKRVAELEAEEKRLAEQFEQIEKELFLMEEFTRSKVQMLEEKINSKFEFARFKLFETQINGGLQDTCKTLYKGVPYGEGLNNAARINVGLDIIETLSKHFNVSVPIFVDNAEAVTKMLPIENQVISLIVSAGDHELRVEKDEVAAVRS